MLRIILEEGLKTLPFIVSAVILFRVAKFPDMGIGGTFLLGSSVLAFTQLHSLPIIIGFVFAILVGIMGGAITGCLFIFARLNSLICGIITALISYSVSYVLLHFQATVGFASITNEYVVGIFSLMMCLAISVFFSTRHGLLIAVAGESPKLLRMLGREPSPYLLLLILIGNAISALAGFLFVGITGVANLRLDVDKIFMAITALILGEGILSLFLIFLKSISKNSKAGTLRKGFNIVLGGSTTGLMCAGVIGVFAYWGIYVGCKKVFNTAEFDRLIIGLFTAILLWLTVLFSRKKHMTLGPWKFHGEIND